MDPALSIMAVSKTYKGARALDEVTFDVPTGETVALLGPNGAGKTTLVNIVLGLRRQDGGQVRLLGVDSSTAIANGSVGAMLQTGEMPLDIRVREAIQLFRSLYPRPLALDTVLEVAGLETLANARLHGLSGGQAQRVRFALAIAGDPKLLLLDEPTVGLDVEARRRFWSTMKTWASQGHTVLFTTHYLDEVDAAADRVVVLRQGRVVADASPGVLRSSVGVTTLRFRAAAASKRALGGLPGVTSVDGQRQAFALRTTDLDGTLAALYGLSIDIRDVQVTEAGMEDVFIELTGAEV